MLNPVNIRSTTKNNMQNEKKKVILVGGSGLVGSRIQELLAETFEVETLGISNGFDITKPATLSPLLRLSSGATVIHLAAKADVDGCEKDKSLGEEGDAWQINVKGAENVADICIRAGHRMIYVSTDFVFDGESTPSGGYSEEDTPNPLNWYGVTKYEGELRVLASTSTHVVLRIAYPYRAFFDEKTDFVRAILSRLQKNEPVSAVTDHIMTPTFIDDIAGCLSVLIEQNAEGIHHCVGSSSLTPAQAVKSIAQAFSIKSVSLKEVTRAEFFKERAPRPYNLTLKNDKIRHLGVVMKTFEDGLQQVKEQLGTKG
ncbi:MAG: hypothetical protein RLZZ455_935 [Candidatus Parcubacteria bacterium]